MDQWLTRHFYNNQRPNAVLVTRFAGNVEVLAGGGVYYHVAINQSRRGTVPESGSERAEPYEIATNPYPTPGMGWTECISRSYLAIMREKLANDMTIYQSLIEQMKQDGFVPADTDDTIPELRTALENMKRERPNETT